MLGAVAGQQTLQAGDVAVGIGPQARAAGTGGVDDAGVVELVGQDQVALAGHGRDGDVVSRPPGGRNDGGLRTLELGEAASSSTCRLLVPQTRRDARTDAKAGNGLDGGGLDGRVGGQAEIVVAAKADDLTAVDNGAAHRRSRWCRDSAGDRRRPGRRGGTACRPKEKSCLCSAFNGEPQLARSGLDNQLSQYANRSLPVAARRVNRFRKRHCGSSWGF